MTGDLLGQALGYAAAGWPVFPCRPGTKRPATEHGFEDATTDLSVIAAWWRRWPAANVAIATGTPGPDVLDVDQGPGGSGWAAFNRLKQAGLLTGAGAAVRTRSGGAHLYYLGTRQSCGSLKRHHLDFRSAGGYVLAPPSYVEADAKGPGGAYELLDHRPAARAIDWAAVRRVLDPPRPAVIRPACRGPVPGSPRVAAALGAEVADRSAALWRLVRAAVADGLDLAAIHDLAERYEPAREKYGERLAAEVDRCLSKIGAAT